MSLTPERRAENLRLIESVREMDWWKMPSDQQSASNRLAHDLPLYEAALAEAEREIERLRNLLKKVYEHGGDYSTFKTEMQAAVWPTTKRGDGYEQRKGTP